MGITFFTKFIKYTKIKYQYNNTLSDFNQLNKDITSIGIDGNLIFFQSTTIAPTINIAIGMFINKMKLINKHFEQIYIVFDGLNKYEPKLKTVSKREIAFVNARLKLSEKMYEAKLYEKQLTELDDEDDTFKYLPISKLLAEIQSDIEKRKRHLNTPKTKDFIKLATVLELLGYNVIFSIHEGDFLLKYLYDNKYIHAVYSEDRDFLALGIDIMITKITKQGLLYFRLADILKRLDIEYDTFLKICILLGTDFNKNIPQCGPYAVYGSMKSKKIDKLFDTGNSTIKKSYNIFSQEFEYDMEANLNILTRQSDITDKQQSYFGKLKKEFDEK